MSGQYTKLPVQATSVPAGSATAANQVLEIAALNSIDSKLTTPVAVTGPLTDTQLRATPVPVSVSGVATAALQTSGNAQLVTIASNQTNGTQVTAVNNFPATQPISGSVTVTQATGTNLHTVIDSGTTTVTQATGTNLHTVIDSGTITTVTAVTAITNALPAGTNLLGNTAEQKSATSTLSNVASSATTVSLLASAATRKGAMVFNDSTQVLYLKFGTTASATSYTVQIPPGAYYEFPAFPALYTGAVDGIWTLANGNARITELT